MDDERNYVADAIDQLGGVTAAVEKTGISTSTWQRWKLERRIANRGVARLVAEMTDVPVDALGRRKVRARRPPSSTTSTPRSKKPRKANRPTPKKAA